VQFLPSLLLALPAGHLADQLDRRRVVLFGQVIESGSLLTLTVVTLAGWASIGVLLPLLFAISVGRALAGPSMQSMLPALVPKEILPKAMAANASAVQAAMIVGPALGGLLSVVGAGFVYATSALLCLSSLTLVSRLRYESTPPKREPATLTSVLAGVRFIRARPDVLGVISLDLFAVLLGGATALLPIFAKEVLHTGPSGFGLLRAAPGIGALLMSFWLARNNLQKNVGRTMFASVAGFGAATIVFALSKVLWLSLLALCLLGAFDMVSMVIRGSLVQLDTPDEMRGRVSAVNSIFISASNQLGEFESGLLAAWIGAVPAAVFGGVGTIAVVVAWLFLFPSLRSRQRLQEA
jgi:MFS family permease